MFRFFRLWLGLLARWFRSHRTLLLENLALRQQLAVLKRRHPRARLHPMDKLFWVLARRVLAGWKKSLLGVSPETMIRWAPAGFRLDWRVLPASTASCSCWASMYPSEASPVGSNERPEIRNLPGAGWPLFAITATLSRPWISSLSQPSPSSCCTASLLLVTDRRQILHVNVTRHPTSTWIAQQLREAFPYESAPRFLLFDHDQKYGLEVPAALRSLQITCVPTAIQSPWQKRVAETLGGQLHAR